MLEARHVPHLPPQRSHPNRCIYVHQRLWPFAVIRAPRLFKSRCVCVCVCVLVVCTWSPSRRNPRASPWSVESADPTTPTMPHASAKCSLPPRPQRPRPTDAAAAAGRWDELRRRRNILAAVSHLEVLEQLKKMRSTVNLPCFPTDKSAGVKKAKKRWCVAVLLPEWSSPKIENRNRSRTTGYW